MTDRELLELAAKAAGIEGKWELDKAFIQERWYFNVPYNNHNMLSGFEWNPLRDDGDALRLAVKLNLLLLPYPLDKAVRVVLWDDDVAPAANFIVSWGEPQDSYAATRRAIVQAAAEIGKEMK